jgi:YVTN family beta-propeller protein
VTLDATARQAAQAVGPRPSTLGPPPFPHDLASRRWRRARRPAILAAGLAVAVAVARLQLPAPPPAASAARARPSLVSITVGRDPAGPAVEDDASVWVANTLDGTVSRVDPWTRRVVATLGAGRNPVAVAAGAKAIWVLDQDGDVARIDPSSENLTTAFALGTPAVAAAAAWIPGPSLAAAANAVWVAEPAAGDAITRIDPVRGVVVATIHTGHVPLALAASAGAAWAANQDGTLTRVDAASGQLLNTTIFASRSPRSGHADLAVALGPSGIWVTDAIGRILRRIDPASGRVLATIRLGLRPGGLAVTGNAVWVENPLDGSLTCVDPRTDTAVRTIRVVSSAPGEIGTSGLVAGPGTVWVADPRGDALIGVDSSRGCSPSNAARQ